MLDSDVIDKIKHTSNTEVIRRLLIKYFSEKGYSSFDRQLYPATMQDLSTIVPILSNKIEVVPHAVEIDTSLGRAVLGWNLFVLGNQRMYLGDTYHNSLRDLASQIRAGAIKVPENGGTMARRQTTPRRVISFITRVLNLHDAGYVDLSQPTGPIRKPGEALQARQVMMGMPSSYFSRAGT